MAKTAATGIALRESVLEWTTMAPGRVGVDVQGSGEVSLGAAGDDAGAAQVREQCSALRRPVSAALDSECVLLRVVSLPTAEADELAGMVELQVSKFSPFPVESMVVSHEVLAEKDGNQVVLIGAAREKVVKGFGDRLRSLGIAPVRLDVAVLGWWHLLDAAGALKGQGRDAVLLMAGPVPQLLVLQDGVPIAFSSLGETEGMADEELAGEVAREMGYTLMSLELERGGEGERSVSVWSRGPLLPGLVELIEQECACPVTVLPLADLPPVSRGIAMRLLARPDGLDLTPESWRSAERSARFRRRTVAAAAAVVSVWLLGLAAVFGGLLYQQKRVTWMQAELARWQAPSLEVRAMRRRVAMIEPYTDKADSALECLREVSRAKPDGIDITSFAYRKGDGVKLTGDADSSGLVIDFNRQLSLSQLFSEVISGAQTVSKGKYRFQLDLKLPGGEE